MAQLTPEEKEQRKQQMAKKKAREKLLGGISTAVVILAIVGFFVWQIRAEDTTRILKEVERNIEECNFSKARAVLAEVITDSGPEETREENKKKIEEYKRKITLAEITYFIDEGDFSKAFDSAKEGGCIDYYQSTVLNRIPIIYEQKGATVLAKTLASLVFPSEYSWSYKQFVRDYNSTLTNVINIIEAEGKKDDADLLRKMLKK